jgi:hypothetical protein
MSAAGDKSSDYCVGANCGSSWVTVKSADGQALNLSGGCQTTCQDCQPIACSNLCIAPQEMKAEGESLSWDGSYFVQSTCGQNYSCNNTACAAPGSYVATMCASPNDSGDAGVAGFCSNTGADPVCVDVAFEYPSDTVVEGVIGM